MEYLKVLHIPNDIALLYIEQSPKALQKGINIDLKLILKWIKAN